jgi:hypothetical protein
VDAQGGDHRRGAACCAAVDRRPSGIRRKLLALEEALLVLKVNPGDKETVECIFRAAHTLKGNAAALGFSGLTEFAHAVEDLLSGGGGGYPAPVFPYRNLDSWSRWVFSLW